MSVHVNKPSILHSYFDVADPRCYDSSGPTYRIVYPKLNTIKTSLANIGPAPIYDSQFNSIITENTSSFIEFAGDNRTNLVNNFTIEIWCSPNRTNDVIQESIVNDYTAYNTNGIFEPLTFSTDFSKLSMAPIIGTNSVSIMSTALTYTSYPLVYETSIPNDKFTHFVIPVKNKQPSLYINSNFAKTGLMPDTPVWIGTETMNVNLKSILCLYSNIGATISFFKGRLAVIRLYNYVLNDKAIALLYEETKDRFAGTFTPP